MKQFLEFWKNFLLGSDTYIAPAIGWTVIFFMSLSHYSIRIWGGIIVVTCLLIFHTYFRQYYHHKIPSLDNQKAVFVLFLGCMSGTVILTQIIFRFWSANATSINIGSAIILNGLIIVPVALLLASLYKYHPTTSHIIGIAMSYFLVFNLAL